MRVCVRKLKREDLLSNRVASSATRLLRVVVVETLPSRVANSHSSLSPSQAARGADASRADCWQGQEA